jgi:hypothetical protein
MGWLISGILQRRGPVTPQRALKPTECTTPTMQEKSVNWVRKLTKPIYSRPERNPSILGPNEADSSREKNIRRTG